MPVSLKGETFERVHWRPPGIGLPAEARGMLEEYPLTSGMARIRISVPRGTLADPPMGKLPGVLARLLVLQGRELSFTNLLDFDSAARIVREFDEPAAAVIKHTNPCGAATGADHR